MKVDSNYLYYHSKSIQKKEGRLKPYPFCFRLYFHTFMAFYPTFYVNVSRRPKGTENFVVKLYSWFGT